MTEQPEREHQSRERAVPCQRCRKDTWNNSAICDDCAFRELEESRKRLV